MRQLTFRGFIRYYVKSVSKYETENLTKLVEEATTENARLVEPLLLYAMCANKEHVLLSRTKDEKLYKEYSDLVANYTMEDLYELFEKKSEKLPAEYHKVWRTYQCRKNQYQTDNNTKELIRKKVVRLQQENNITNYRIYTDLKLNAGNLNSWLKYGYSDKVSLDTARITLKYLESIIQ